MQNSKFKYQSEKVKYKKHPQRGYHNFDFCSLIFDFTPKRGGFTILEIVVILAIIVLISSIMLTAFPGFSDEAGLIRGEQELALNLRRAQNIALAVAQVTLADGSRKVPRRIGVHFDISTPGFYFLFVDEDGNNIYNATIDNAIESPIVFQRGIHIDSLSDGNGNPLTSLNVVFSSPQADMVLTNDQSSIGNSAVIKLRGVKEGLPPKVITVRTTGQIAIQ